MAAINIKLSALWAALMLTYLLGDVLRLYFGDVTPGKISGMPINRGMTMFIAILMLIPILMVYLSVTLSDPVNRWANIIVAVGFFLFNLVGLPTYPGAYDKFLIGVGLVINVLTVWHAWRWM